jgi:TolB-like protein
MNKKYLIIYIIAIVVMVIAFTATGFATGNKPSVAVLDFESMGTEEYLGKAVSEIMRTALVSNQNYRVVERSQINKALSEQKFQQSGNIDDKSAVEIGKVLGADLIIVGSVVKIGNAFTINSRLIDVKTGEAKLGRNVTGTDLNLLTNMSNELVDNLFGTENKQARQKAPVDNEVVMDRTAQPYAFENANYWNSEIEIVQRSTDPQDCARRCDKNPNCKVASFHGPRATDGWANICVLRSTVGARNIRQVDIRSWVKP